MAHRCARVYLRVSTDEQIDTRAGLNAQRDACRAWCDREGYTFAEPFEEIEGVSGATPLDRRDALLDAIAALEPGDVLLVAKRDRLARDPMIAAMIDASVRQKKCRLMSAAGEGTDDDSPTSVLMRRMVDAFAEYERLLISSRTKAALGAKRRRGERTGRIPFGSTLVDDGRRSRAGLPVGLAADPAERIVLKRMLDLRAAGWPLRRIAWALSAHGLTTRAGKPWGVSTIHHLCQRWGDDPDALAILEAIPDDFVAPRREWQTKPIQAPNQEAPPPEAAGGPAP